MDEFTTEDNQTTSTDWFEQCVDDGQKRCSNTTANDDLETTGRGFVEDEETKLGTFAKLRSASKPHSTPLTLKWLEENYEIAMGVCIPRSTLYFHYLDYCEKNDTQPVNAASFGKIIKQQFPQITTRRLGTRGQSKYNYYGIGVRESSSYYEVMYSAKGIQSSGEGKKGSVKQIVAYSPRSKLGTLLPEFPDIKDIKLPANVPEDKVLTFMMMYRTHCQRILDTVIRANFDEVQSFLLHFWQGMPQHMVPILDSQTIVLLVGVCDSILYKAIANVLMPTVLQALPESLTQVIRRFAKQLDDWLKLALDSLPKGLQKIKFDLARRFAQVLRRQTSLNHLCQAARTVIHSPEIISQMLDDWLSVDLNSIIKQTLYTMDNYSERDHQTIINLSGEYEHLMEEQAPLDSYIEWLDTMVERCVVKPSSKEPGTLRQIARQFLLMWSCFGTRVIRDMTLHSAPSFGSFHLMHLMFDDYVLYLVETLHSQERANEFLRVIKGEVSADVAEELLTPESSLLKEGFTSNGRSAFTPTYTSRHQHSERDSVITNARDVIGGVSNSKHLSDQQRMNMLRVQDIGCSRNAAIASNNITTTVGCTNGFPDFDRQTSDLMTMQSSFNLSMTSGSPCGQFAPTYSQATPTTQTAVHNPEESGTYNINRQLQVTLSPLYVSSGALPITVTSNDSTRYGSTMDWGSQFTNVTQQDITRIGDQSSFSQYQGIRPYSSDHSSHAYFDQQNVTRSYLPFTNDLQFPGITTQPDGSDVTNNNGKRINDDVNTRSYKRPTREQFSLQAQLEEGFI